MQVDYPLGKIKWWYPSCNNGFWLCSN